MWYNPAATIFEARNNLFAWALCPVASGMTVAMWFTNFKQILLTYLMCEPIRYYTSEVIRDSS